MLHDSQTRCWIFGSALPLTGADPALVQNLSGFMSGWQSHGEAVSGTWTVFFDHFLVVLQTPDGAAASGCSIDSMKGEIQALERKLGTPLLDAGRIFFRDSEGGIRAVTRAEFKALAQAGRIGPDTEVFDITLTNAQDLRPGVFNKPLRDSWHLRLYEQARATAKA